MHRYAPEPELDGLVQRFWIPVWWVRPGQEAPQRVLQYPVCLVVVTPEYARLSGVVPGLSTTRLTGDGWAVGVMLSPAAGFLLAGASVAAYADAPRPYLPVDRERALVNRLVAHVEQHPDVLRVAQVCEAFALTERALQRLVPRRLGLTPKWLARRRLAGGRGTAPAR